ncbi:MAG: lipid-binding SYLF domain-containing protein [Ginsengibacter sp.]
MKPKKLIALFISVLFLSSFVTQAQDKQIEKIESSTKVLEDFGSMKESIPSELLKVTQGIIIVPKLINAGFVLAGKRGKGIAMVKLENGTWSNPVFITITGGSLGFQAGIQSVDLVLIFKSASTLLDIGKGSFTLGGDISVTAGPVGRNSSASTDYKMEAEVYSYSRSKGLFAGISISGSAIDIDSKYNEAFYGNETDAKEIFDAVKVQSAPVKALKTELKKLYQ